MMRRAVKWTAIKWTTGAAALLLAAAAAVWHLGTREGAAVDASAPALSTPAQIERGAYLARVGNCASCHSARGGAAYAGGRAIETPFGAVYASNLTPDAATGIGAWSPAQFWRAMHSGKSADGRLLVPAFPYTSYTQITREDSDALFAFLRNQPPVNQANRPHDLRFPFNTQAALAAWRALYFEPQTYQTHAARSAEWNRGAYLVQGLGHCSACHGARNALGGTTRGLDLAGGLIPVQNWYAPSLTSPHEAGVGTWPASDVVALLKTGLSPQASVAGPMAEVVLGSTQYLSEPDLQSMAVFLKSVEVAAPAPSVTPATAPKTQSADQSAAGAKLYEQNCAQCHGDTGRGVAGAYPALAGNRAVVLPQTANLVQIVLNGGYAPATAGNPRPFGMPPFVLVLSDAEIATVLTHIRQSWGNAADSITPLEVNRIRSAIGR